MSASVCDKHSGCVVILIKQMVHTFALSWHNPTHGGNQQVIDRQNSRLKMKRHHNSPRRIGVVY